MALEVSVVIPCRDGWPDVRRAVASALGQEDVSVEVIVVDDASGAPLVDRLAPDDRLRVLRHDTPQRAAAARNAGLAQARAEWVAFLDHDDVWAPGKLRRQLDAAAESGAEWAYAAALVVDEQLRPHAVEHAPPAARVADLMRRRSCVPGGGSSVVARTALVRERGGFDPAFSLIADWDMWLRLADRPAAAVEEPLLAFVRRSGGMSAADGHTAIAEGERLAAKHPDADIDVAWLARWTAGSQRRGGRRLAAARTYLGGVRHGDFPLGLARAALALLEPRAPGPGGRARQAPPVPPWLTALR